jgi:ATP-dependent helicase HrpB
LPEQTVARAVADVLPRTSGNVLCFLPGRREIERATGDCAEVARIHNLDVLPLHGSLDSREQDAALDPSPRRRVIIATNIAETSLTVPGVSAVVDAGVHKVARYNADRAVDSLVTERITLDSADQRAGRAARLGPGIAIRLWDARDKLRPYREAEIHRIDLSGVILSIAAYGSSPDQFEWFDRPNDDRLAAAIALLERLGALEHGRITPLGRQMQALPLHPRLARVLIAGHGSAEATEAVSALSDDRASQLEQIARRQFDDNYRPHITDTELQLALLRGYPDRVAKRRSGDRFTLSSGHGAVLGRETKVHAADWIVALDVTAGRTSQTTEALIRAASPIDPEWLTPTTSELKHEFEATTGSVKALEIDWYDAIPLREHFVAPQPEQRARLLAAAWLEKPIDESSAQLLNRLKFAGTAIDIRDTVVAQAPQANRLSDIELSESALPWEIRERLNTLAPAHLAVPSGRQMRIEYKDDGSAAVAVKLQELFGLAETPRIGPARTPITFELLAPNGRAVQTTRDLKSFWERTYPEVRKELRGRYPRHPWPDDPWTATPTHKTKKRSS